MRTATGLRSEACASRPSRWASRGMLPPPAKGSRIGGGLPFVDFRISSRASRRSFSSRVFSQTTSRSMRWCRRSRSFRCSSSVGNSSGRALGSSTSWAKRTARAAASGLRAHHRCSVEGCPCRMDFSRADSRLIASSGSATSISFRACTMPPAPLRPRPGQPPNVVTEHSGGSLHVQGKRVHRCQNGVLPLAHILAQSPRRPVASKLPRSVVAKGASR